jgi:hypothetical protein
LETVTTDAGSPARTRITSRSVNRATPPEDSGTGGLWKLRLTDAAR